MKIDFLCRHEEKNFADSDATKSGEAHEEKEETVNACYFPADYIMCDCKLKVMLRKIVEIKFFAFSAQKLFRIDSSDFWQKGNNWKMI